MAGRNVVDYEALLQELEEARQGQRRAEEQQRQAEEQQRQAEEQQRQAEEEREQERPARSSSSAPPSSRRPADKPTRDPGNRFHHLQSTGSPTSSPFMKPLVDPSRGGSAGLVTLRP